MYISPKFYLTNAHQNICQLLLLLTDKELIDSSTVDILPDDNDTIDQTNDFVALPPTEPARISTLPSVLSRIDHKPASNNLSV